MILIGLTFVGAIAFALTGLFILGSGAMAYRDRLAHRYERLQRDAASAAWWSI